MTRFEELIRKLRLELECRKYAQSSIDTYASCLAVFLRSMNGKPKPLQIDEIKIFLAGIKNQNYHKQAPFIHKNVLSFEKILCKKFYHYWMNLKFEKRVWEMERKHLEREIKRLQSKLPAI